MRGHDIIQRSIDAINAGDATAYAAGYVDAAVLVDPFYPEPVRGRPAIEADMAGLLRALPDAVGAIVSVVADGDVIATEVEISGTHDGAWETPDGSIDPTGRRLVIQTCDVVHLAPDGRYTRNRRYYDVGVVLAQLGLAP